MFQYEVFHNILTTRASLFSTTICDLLSIMNALNVHLKGAVSRQSSSFCLIYFANYSPSITMELKVSKEITCK